MCVCVWGWGGGGVGGGGGGGGGGVESFGGTPAHQSSYKRIHQKSKTILPQRSWLVSFLPLHAPFRSGF